MYRYSSRHYYRLLLIIGVSTFATSLGANVQTAQATMSVFCDRKEVLDKVLSEKFKEDKIVLGDSESGDLLTIYANKQTKHYTITRTSKERSCVIDAGTSLRQNYPKAKDI